MHPLVSDIVYLHTRSLRGFSARHHHPRNTIVFWFGLCRCHVRNTRFFARLTPVSLFSPPSLLTDGAPNITATSACCREPGGDARFARQVCFHTRVLSEPSTRTPKSNNVSITPSDKGEDNPHSSHYDALMCTACPCRVRDVRMFVVVISELICALIIMTALHWHVLFTQRSNHLLLFPLLSCVWFIVRFARMTHPLRGVYGCAPATHEQGSRITSYFLCRSCTDDDPSDSICARSPQGGFDVMAEAPASPPPTPSNGPAVPSGGDEPPGARLLRMLQVKSIHPYT